MTLNLNVYNFYNTELGQLFDFKGDKKFELYKLAQDEIQYLRSLVSTMANKLNNTTVYSNQA